MRINTSVDLFSLINEDLAHKIVANEEYFQTHVLCNDWIRWNCLLRMYMYFMATIDTHRHTQTNTHIRISHWHKCCIVCNIMLPFLKQEYTRLTQIKDLILPNSFTSFYGAEITAGAIKVRMEPSDSDRVYDLWLCSQQHPHPLLVLMV